MSALESLRQHYRQRDLAARRWKASGGRVVGYLCDNVPEEMIMAAGCLPHRLSGDPEAGGAAVERYVQPFALPFSARSQRPQFVESMLELLLDGRYDFLDALVVPHTRKSIQATYRELTLASAEYAQLKVPELVYLDRAYTPFYASEVFNRHSLREFKTWLEAWSGRAITSAGISAAIAETNRTRGLLLRLAELRWADPPRVSGSDALAIIGASTRMAKAEFNALLEQFLANPADQPTAPDRARVFVGGSPQDHTRLYALIEDCGALVVAEDHCWGSRLGEFPLDPALDPFEALADRYHRKPACSIAFPLATVVDACSRRALEGNVNGAIFWVTHGDTGHVWDTPDEIQALQAHGVPSLFLKDQPYAVDNAPSLRAEITSFVKSLSR